MVAMSNETDNSSNGAGAGADAGSGEGEVLPVDFDALERDVLKGVGGRNPLKLIQTKTGWNAITLSIKEMPGEGVERTIGALFSGGPTPFESIRKSLDYMKLAILESTETDGGAKLDDLAFGEWMDLLEQWANS